MVVKKLVTITEKTINLSTILKETEDYRTGACLVFLGTVRNHSENGSINSILYEAYNPLVEKMIKKIEKEVEKRYKPCRCKIVHRIGRLKLGEVSVVIVVRTPHRKEAYKASRWAIEKVKKTLPIWKKEYTKDGKEKWSKGNKLEMIK